MWPSKVPVVRARLKEINVRPGRVAGGGTFGAICARIPHRVQSAEFNLEINDRYIHMVQM